MPAYQEISIDDAIAILLSGGDVLRRYPATEYLDDDWGSVKENYTGTWEESAFRFCYCECEFKVEVE